MRYRWLRRAVVTLGIAAGALTLGAGVASANTLEDVAGITQEQSASNTNSTSQDANATAETNHHNVNVPIAILSPGANGGDVHQSDRADTDATASNGNSSACSVRQSKR